MSLEGGDWLDRLLERAPLPVWGVGIAFGHTNGDRFIGHRFINKKQGIGMINGMLGRFGRRGYDGMSLAV